MNRTWGDDTQIGLEQGTWGQKSTGMERKAQLAPVEAASRTGLGALLRWPKPRRGGPRPLGSVSDRQGQFGERIGKAGSTRYVSAEIVEAPAEVLDKRVAGDDDPGGTVCLQPAHRTEPSLEPSVVGLEGVVGMDLGVICTSRW